MRRAISSALTLAAALMLSVATARAAPSCSDRLQQQLIDARAAPAAQRPNDRTCISGSTGVSAIQRRQRGASPCCGFNSRKQAKITRQANFLLPNTARS